MTLALPAALSLRKSESQPPKTPPSSVPAFLTGGFLIACFFAVAFFAQNSAHRYRVASPIPFLATALIKRPFRIWLRKPNRSPRRSMQRPWKSECAGSFCRPFMSTS